MDSFVFLAHVVLVRPLLSFLRFPAFGCCRFCGISCILGVVEFVQFGAFGFVGFVLLRPFLQCVH